MFAFVVLDFVFFSTKSRTSPNWPILFQMGCKNLSQSVYEV